MQFIHTDSTTMCHARQYMYIIFVTFIRIMHIILLSYCMDLDMKYTKWQRHLTTNKCVSTKIMTWFRQSGACVRVSLASIFFFSFFINVCWLPFPFNFLFLCVFLCCGCNSHTIFMIHSWIVYMTIHLVAAIAIAVAAWIVSQSLTAIELCY